MPEAIIRLEQALQYLEHWGRMFNIMNQMYKLSGEKPRYDESRLPKNWSELRNYLLKLRPMAQLTTQQQQELLWKFTVMDDTSNEESVDIINFLAPMIAGWTVNSRRAYSVSRELQALLVATSLRNMCWGDLVLPFQSFAILLEQPIQLVSLGKQYDSILIHKDSKFLHFLMLSTDLPNAIIPAKGMKSCERLVRLRKVIELYEAIDNLDLAHRDPPGIMLRISYSMSDPTWPIESSLLEIRNQRKPIINSSLRGDVLALQGGDETGIHLAICFCLYLSTLSRNSTHRSQWKKTPTSNQKVVKGKFYAPITDEAQVCYVTSAIRLSEAEIQTVESVHTQAGREVSPHFTQGHFRRPPGRGADPDQPKTVQVRPYFVKRQALAEGALPGGAKTKVQ